MDKVAGSHRQCVVRILRNPWQRRQRGKFRGIMILWVSLTRVTTGISTCKCDIHRDWSPLAGEYFQDTTRVYF